MDLPGASKRCMRLAILQLNFTAGDLEGNARKIAQAVSSLAHKNVDLCITSELSLLGYPPKDLLLNDNFIKAAWEKLKWLARELKEYPPTLVGIADFNKSKIGKPLLNCAALITNGRIAQKFYKTLLPTYDVFDEGRYFERGNKAGILRLKGKKIGITICEDIWGEVVYPSRKLYRIDPLAQLNLKVINYFVNLSASPFVVGKQKIRESILGNIAKKYKVDVIYANQVGGNDDLVFDGRSCAFWSDGKLATRANVFDEDVVIFDTEADGNEIKKDIEQPEAEIWTALVLGTRDYIFKSGFTKCLLGLSGGVDSSLTAVIGVEAINNENVLGVFMPSKYTSKQSMQDVHALAKNLGIRILEIPINEVVTSINKSLTPAFVGYKQDVTEENIQARIRGLILMALSNKYKAMVLSTGNKSELAVGYTTLYGDMSGGLAVISDVPKTMVWRIARWLNKKRGGIIPASIINRSPTAELAPNQKDQDSLPPYEMLDEILYRYLQLHQSIDEIVSAGLAKKTVREVVAMVKRAEFKRKQAPIGLKVTDRAFGTGWRMPVINRFRE